MPGRPRKGHPGRRSMNFKQCPGLYSLIGLLVARPHAEQQQQEVDQSAGHGIVGGGVPHSGQTPLWLSFKS